MKGKGPEVFTTVCNLKCPEHAGDDHTPSPQTCARFICPTLRECVVRRGKAGDWERLNKCLKRLDDARKGDKFGEDDEEDAAAEITAFVANVRDTGI